jgi:hypothetical protein
MQKLLPIIAALLLTPVQAMAADTRLATASAGTQQGLPYEMVISHSCPYSYDGVTDVVERVFNRKGIDPLWEGDATLASNTLYLSINVECVGVTERNSSYSTTVEFARYDESQPQHSFNYGKNGYGSDRLFKRRLSESVEEALNSLLDANNTLG